eukprot:Pgem_evm1s7610
MGRTLFTCDFVDCVAKPSKKHNIQRHVWMVHLRKTMTLEKFRLLDPQAAASLSLKDIPELDYKLSYKSYVTRFISEYQSKNDESNSNNTDNIYLHQNHNHNHNHDHIIKSRSSEQIFNYFLHSSRSESSVIDTKPKTKHEHYLSTSTHPNNQQHHYGHGYQTNMNPVAVRRRGSLSPCALRKTQLQSLSSFSEKKANTSFYKYE